MYKLPIAVFDHFRIDEEAYRHLHALARCQHLFGKAKAVDLFEKRPGGIGGYVIARLPCDRMSVGL